MGLLAGDDRERRCALQPQRFDVPPGTAQHLVPGRGERGDVGRVRAGHEANARLLGQTQSSRIQRAVHASSADIPGDMTWRAAF